MCMKRREATSRTIIAHDCSEILSREKSDGGLHVRGNASNTKMVCYHATQSMTVCVYSGRKQSVVRLTERSRRVYLNIYLHIKERDVSRVAHRRRGARQRNQARCLCICDSNFCFGHQKRRNGNAKCAKIVACVEISVKRRGTAHR